MNEICKNCPYYYGEINECMLDIDIACPEDVPKCFKGTQEEWELGIDVAKDFNDIEYAFK